MENKKEGYTEVVIPEQRFNSCKGCKYLKNFQNKQFEYIHGDYCTFYSEVGYTNEKSYAISDPYFPLKTPDWCPFLNK